MTKICCELCQHQFSVTIEYAKEYNEKGFAVFCSDCLEKIGAKREKKVAQPSDN